MLKQSLHKINVKAISGEEQALSRFKGKVLLIVNVASQCGFTPQYLALQKLYEKYRDQGFCILAFPSNDFGRQEPAEDKEIEKFCVKILVFPLIYLVRSECLVRNNLPCIDIFKKAIWLQLKKQE